MWDSHIEGTQEGASEQILLIVGISPTLDVAHTGTVVEFLNEERLIDLPILSPDNGGERKLGIARDTVDDGLATVG